MKANIIEARLDAKKKANKRMERILLDDHVIENLRKMTDYIDKVSWEKCHFTNEFLFVMYVKGTGSYLTAKEITKRIDGKLIKLPKFLKKNSMKENIQWYEEYFESVGFKVKSTFAKGGWDYIYLFTVVVPNTTKQEPDNENHCNDCN